jgi:eukaryotic-like serine/threonine-protein kinase
MATIIGNFEILEQIASGGMAVIYKARQTTLDRVVVIKELKSAFKEDSEIVTRFEQEAKAVARLQHENIINVIEFWHKKGSYYIAMEYLDGADLARIIEKTGPLPLNIGLIIASQIARALSYAHERGIVHRDLKPPNILVSKDGKVKLVDFGIAHIEEELGGKDLTRAGIYMGTPAYMSPEQADGKPAEPSSDIWSFGCVLYEIFSGRRAFMDHGKSTMMENIRKGKSSPRSDHFNETVPWGLRRMINRCLKVKPEKRPTTRELMTYLVHLAQKNNKGKDYSMVLRSFFEGKKGFEPVVEEKTVVKRPPLQDRTINGVLWLVVAATIVALMTGAGYVFLRGNILATIKGSTARTGESEKNSFTGTALGPAGENRLSLPPRAAIPPSPAALSMPNAAVPPSQAALSVSEAAHLSRTAVLLSPAAMSPSQTAVPQPRAAVPSSLTAMSLSPATGAPSQTPGQVSRAAGALSRSTVPESRAAVSPPPTAAVVSPGMPEIGYIKVVVRPWAEIYIDGKKVGLTPTDKRFQVPAGRHKVLLRNPYCQSFSREVEVSNNGIVLVKASLKKRRSKK